MDKAKAQSKFRILSDIQSLMVWIHVFERWGGVCPLPHTHLIDRGLPFSTYAPRGWWVESTLLYISIAYYMQKGSGWVQKACKIAYILNGRSHIAFECACYSPNLVYILQIQAELFYESIMLFYKSRLLAYKSRLSFYKYRLSFYKYRLFFY